MIDHVFGEMDRTAGPGFDREGNLAEVLVVGSLVGVLARGLQCMVDGARQGQAALFRRMAQHDPTVFRIAGPVMEHPTCKDSRLSRIVASVRELG